MPAMPSALTKPYTPRSRPWLASTSLVFTVSTGATTRIASSVPAMIPATRLVTGPACVPGSVTKALTASKVVKRTAPCSGTPTSIAGSPLYSPMPTRRTSPMSDQPGTPLFSWICTLAHSIGQSDVISSVPASIPAIGATSSFRCIGSGACLVPPPAHTTGGPSSDALSGRACECRLRTLGRCAVVGVGVSCEFRLSTCRSSSCRSCEARRWMRFLLGGAGSSAIASSPQPRSDVRQHLQR
mmetsp:Transcript_10007/g.24898  ORF Transcript_10007/g.24898 Transcript_10007/m.24898 type:complete len:241 (-) Transcript_10007:27-749(-)